MYETRTQRLGARSIGGRDAFELESIDSGTNDASAENEDRSDGADVHNLHNRAGMAENYGDGGVVDVEGADEDESPFNVEQELDHA